MMNSNQSSTKPSLSKIWPWAVIAVALIGIADTLYLIIKTHYGDGIQCFIVGGCEKVLTSKYSVFAGVPLTWWGLGFYVSVFLVINIFELYGSQIWIRILSWMTAAGFIISLILLCIQVFVIKALCFYCLTSLISSAALFILVIIIRRKSFQLLNLEISQ